jgi:hypothetical protein
MNNFYHALDLEKYLTIRNDVVEIGNKLYTEVFNHNFHYDLKKLIETPWHYDQINESLAVIQGTHTTRYEDYHNCWITGLPRAIGEFLVDINTRKAIIPFHKPNGSPTCLTSIQFQMRNRNLFVTANFRSWELSEFADYDLCLLSYLTSEMAHHLYNPKLSILTINATNAHVLKGEKL